MKRNLLLACFACAALLCACAGPAETPSPAPEDPLPAASAPPPELVPLQTGETVYGAAGPDGYYSILPLPRADGSLNIQYTDYASMQTVFLCAQPNCAHDSDSCTSYQSGGSGVSLMMVGRRLVLVSPGTGPWGEQPSPPCVRVCDPDGSRRREVAAFDPNQQLEAPYLTDGKNLYATLLTSQAQETTAELVSIDLASGAVSSVLPLDREQSEKVCSGAGQWVILLSLKGNDPNDMESDTAVCYQRVNVGTLERETVFEYSIGEGRATAFSEALVFYDAEQNSVQSIDWRTGGQQILARDVLPAGVDMIELDLVFYDEGRLLYSFESPDHTTDYGGRAFFIAGPEEAEKTEFSLTYLAQHRPTPVCPIARIEDGKSYFVIADETLQPWEDRSEDGAPFTAHIPIPVYGKIGCEAFWAGSGTVQKAE